MTNHAVTDVLVDVLVIGAGPTGLTMAIELRRRGISCRIVDKSSGPVKHSQALAVQSRTMELFAAMGVVGDALAVGVKARGLVIAASGAERAAVSLKGIPSTYPYIFLLTQDRTERILLARLAALGGCVERETCLTALTQEVAGVTATLTGADGRTETVRARYVVGADGAHSAVRHALGVPFAGGAYDDTLWLADVHVSGDVRRDAMLLCFGNTEAFIALIPIDTEGRFRAIIRPHDHDIADAPTLPVIQAILDALAPTKLTLHDPIWLSAFRLHHRKATRFRVGRVFLAGDAAHIHSPAGGQGMNTGIQDAANLAWKLAFALRGVATPALLESYHTERDAVAEQLLRTTDAAFQLVRSRNPLVRRLRDLLLTAVIPHEAVRRRLVPILAQLAIRYKTGAAVVRDPGGGGVQTGRPRPGRPARQRERGGDAPHAYAGGDAGMLHAVAVRWHRAYGGGCRRPRPPRGTGAGTARCVRASGVHCSRARRCSTCREHITLHRPDRGNAPHIRRERRDGLSRAPGRVHRLPGKGGRRSHDGHTARAPQRRRSPRHTTRPDHIGYTGGMNVTERQRAMLSHIRPLIEERGYDAVSVDAMAAAAGVAKATFYRVFPSKEAVRHALAAAGVAADQLDARDGREAVLAAATRVFAEAGYAGATLDVIAAAAGMSKAGVYWHFEGKEAILIAVIERFGPFDTLTERLSAAEARGDEPIADVLTARTVGGVHVAICSRAATLFRAIFAEMTQNPAMAGVFQQFIIGAGRCPRSVVTSNGR